MNPRESNTFQELNRLAAEYLRAKPARKRAISAIFDKQFPLDVEDDNAA